MTTPDRFDEMAERIASTVRTQIIQHATTYNYGEACYDGLRRDITTALRSMVPPLGHVMDEHGIVTRFAEDVALWRTLDNALVGPGCWVFWRGARYRVNDVGRIPCSLPVVGLPGAFTDVHCIECFAFPDAAEAAAKSGGAS